MIVKQDGKLSKTVVINSAIATLGAAIPLLPQLQHQIPDNIYPWIVVGVSLLNVFLRQVTSQPMR